MDTNSHPFKRHKERFGKELSIFKYQEIINKVKKQLYVEIPYDKSIYGERVTIIVLYDNIVNKLVYNMVSNVIVTFLPEAPVDKLYKKILLQKENNYETY